jgi:hypothetical protein
MSREDGQFLRAQKKKNGGANFAPPQKVGPKMVSCLFEFESVFLIWHNSFFSFIGVEVTLEVRLRAC